MPWYSRYEDMTDAEKARRYRHFTREQFIAAMRAWGLDAAGCTDPDALRDGAEIQAAAEREAERDAGPDAA